jgi:RNA polymerase sigma factor (sigma-70 family)
MNHPERSVMQCQGPMVAEGWRTVADTDQGMQVPDENEPDAADAAALDLDDPPAPAVAEAAGAALPPRDNAALAQLIFRVMRQDEAALADLYDSLSSRVYAVALHITRHVACAEEVMQDTFWQIWRQAPRFDATRGSATAWVLTMARSRALDALRANKRDPLQSNRQFVDEPTEFADALADDPLDLLNGVRRDSQLHATLAALEPLKRQLISLAFYRGLTQEEIATHMALPLGTVKSHFRRTLAALRVALGPDFELHAGGGVR